MEHLARPVAVSFVAMLIGSPLFLAAGEALAQAPPSEPTQGSVVEYLPCTAASDELNFPNYWAGPSFEGLELGAVIRTCATPYPDGLARNNDVTYVYQDCTLLGACTEPIQVQSSPARERPKALYDIGPDWLPGPEPKDTIVEGVPAARFEGGHRLEIYDSETTIVIFGDDRAQIDRFAAALAEGPTILTQLAAYGLFFDTGCVDAIRGCQADRSPSSDFQELSLGIFFYWIAPFLVALLWGRAWLLLVPLLGWSLFFLGLDRGWWGSGLPEPGWILVPFTTALGVADVAAGLVLRWLILAAGRSRRAARA